MNDSPTRFRIARSVEELPASAWQRLVRGRPALRLEMLRTIGRHSTSPVPMQFFLLEDSEGLAAAAVCEPVATEASCNRLDTLLFGRAMPLLNRLGASTHPALLFQAPIMRQSPLVVRAGEVADERRRADELLAAIEEHAARAGFGIAFVGVSDDDAAAAAALRARGYLDSEFDSVAQLGIEWSDFDSYVRHLRRSSLRASQNARHERNRNRRNGVEIRQVPCTDAYVAALYRLARDHYVHKNRRDPLYGPGFLPELARALGEDLLLFEAVRNGETAAMLGVVRSGDVGLMAWIGIELRDRPNDFTYANILFYHPANWAPALGIRKLLYGTAVQQSKARRGCRLLGSHIFYRPQQRRARLIARPFLALHQSWQRRKRI